MRSSRSLLVLLVALPAGAFAACSGSPSGTRAAAVGDDASTQDGDTVTGNQGADGGNDGATPDASPDDGGATDADAAIDDAGTDANIDANGPLFACGPTLECYQYVQFCSIVTGVHGGQIINCNEPPDACAGDLTCACLATTGITTPCTGSTEDGGITVTATE
jgi:hypothetical protein